MFENKSELSELKYLCKIYSLNIEKIYESFTYDGKTNWKTTYKFRINNNNTIISSKLSSTKKESEEEVIRESIKTIKENINYLEKYKTEICTHYIQRTCKYKKDCTFAHGLIDLNETSFRSHILKLINKQQQEINNLRNQNHLLITLIKKHSYKNNEYYDFI